MTRELPRKTDDERLTDVLVGFVIVLVCVVAAVVYGILHDLVTAHLCVEYFTVFHPIIIETDDPVTLALLWGLIATWWVGALLGTPLAVIARWGRRPSIGPLELIRPILFLLIAMGIGSLLLGGVGNVLANLGAIWVHPSLAPDLPPETHVPFLTALWAHNAAYGVGILGGIVLWVLTYRKRKRLQLKAEAAAVEEQADVFE